MMAGSILTVVICLSVVSAGCGTFKLQAEDFKTKGKIVKNTKASGGKAVHLRVGQQHQMSFCLQEDTKVAVQQVRYLNEGTSKSVVVHLDAAYVDMVRTLNGSQCKKLKDKFTSVTEVGEKVTLARGRHVVRVQVTSGDEKGIDIDMVVLDVEDSDLTFDTFRCKQFCNTQVPFWRRSPVKDAVSPAKAVQESYRTNCAEADNVKILLFHDDVKRYDIRARHPSYHTLANHREADFTTCKFATNSLWEVRGVSFTGFEYDNKTLNVEGKMKNSVTAEMTATFELQGRDDGMNDPDVGNIFTVTFFTIPTLIKAKLMVYGRSGKWKPFISRKIKAGNMRTVVWKIPDYTWDEGNGNKMKIILTGKRVKKVRISKMKLEKRWLKGDETVPIFNDGNVILEGVKIDLWWLRAPIELTVAGEDNVWKIHYFRFYTPVPWTDGFSQVFVMYQDGNVRLLPSSPHGADWIPFGSSVLIGQVNTSVHRPAAEVTRVHITPESHEITVFYKDGGIVLITLEITMDETIAHVKVLHLAQDPTRFPFVSFRSMWVKDGNSDVDHVSSNGLHGHHIMDPWSQLFGYSFTFYRQCISKHNTQSPDINIEIVE